jgi:PPP family 3-phenylpropionic acid transporter
MIAFYDPFLNVYLSEKGLSAFQVGLLAMFMPLMTLLLAPLVSSLADRRRWRIRILQWCLVGWAVVLLAYGIPSGFWGLALMTLLLGAFRSSTAPISDSVVARMAARYGIGYGSLRLWGSLGFALIAIASGALWQRMGLSLMFAFSAVAAIPVMLVAARLEEGPPVPLGARRPARELFRDRGLVVLYLVAFLVGIGLVSTFIFGGIYMRQLGGGQLAVGLLFGLSALIEVPTMQGCRSLIARLGGPQALLVGCVVSVASVIGYALAETPGQLIAASIGKGVGFGLFFVTLVYLVDQRAPAEWTSTAQSVLHASLAGMAPLLTAAVSGRLYDLAGAPTLFLAVSAFAIAGSLCLLFAIQRGYFRVPFLQASAQA